MDGNYFIIGIDEVGRGSLAGPVTVAAVAVPKKMRFSNQTRPRRDSKRLTPKQREEWFYHICRRNISYATASVSPRVIDRINITRAANRAATRALAQLIKKYRLPSRRLNIFLDGGLYLDKSSLISRELRKKARTVIRGDERYVSVRLASIVAKVTRDRYMVKKNRIFPQYGFAAHKGYGTKNHCRAITRHGLVGLHRLTFTSGYHKLKSRKAAGKPTS